jgi:hypothetical protein
MTQIREQAKQETLKNAHPHSTLEYVEWMEKVWKANHERNNG